MSVVGDYKNTDEVRFYDADELHVASLTFNGGYEKMPLVIANIASWAESNSYDISGKMINIFHISYEQDNNPENWITEACYVITNNQSKEKK